MPTHNPFKYFPDRLLLEVGKISFLRANFNYRVLGLADHLVATRQGDQGIAKLFANTDNSVVLLEKLLTLAKIRNVKPFAIATLEKILEDHAEDFRLAAEVSTSAWTFLGGSKDPWFGCFSGNAVKNGDLVPEWHQFTVKQLRALRTKLTAADEKIDSIKALFWLATPIVRTIDKPKALNAQPKPRVAPTP